MGKHPLVCRLLKGAFNLRPPTPRYSQLWEVKKVLSFLKQTGESSSLQLKELTRKLAMLLALVLARRSSDLARLLAMGVQERKQAVVIPVKELAKQSRPGNAAPSSVVVASFKANSLLCPVTCLKAYLKRTAGLGPSGCSQLFIAIIRPHRPVQSCTVARWF